MYNRQPGVFFENQKLICHNKMRLYLIVNNGDIGSRGKGHGGDTTDVFSKLCSHLQSPITREGPEYSIDQIFL